MSVSKSTHLRFIIFTGLLFGVVLLFVLLKTKNKKPERTIKMIAATFHPRTGNSEVEGLYHFKELVERKTNGRIMVDVFYGGTLGGERELVEQLKLGTIHLCLGGWATRSTYINNLIPWGVPYLFSSKQQIMESIEGKIGKYVKRAFAAKGIEWMGIYFRGNRELTTNKPIYSPEDLKGISVRLPENPDWIVVWEAFGCMPSPIPSPEVFGSLQTGIVDAQENPISSNYDKKLWEVQKYTILTHHIIDINTYLVSSDFLNSLNDKDKQLIQDAILETLTWCTEYAEARESEMIKTMKDYGMLFIAPDLCPFQEIALSKLDHFKSRWEPWVYEETLKILNRAEDK